MSLPNILFYIFAGVSILSGLLMLFSKNVFYATLLLLTTLLSIAGIYALSYAEFVAVTQIMVYAGGVLVVIVFGIMLTAKENEKALVIKNANIITGSLLIGFLFYILVTFISAAGFARQLIPATVPNNIQEIGIVLLSDYLFPFEIVGVLLLVTLIGASITASHKTKKER